MDCFTHGLPHLQRDFDASPGTTLSVAITGESIGHSLLSKGLIQQVGILQKVDSYRRLDKIH